MPPILSKLSAGGLSAAVVLLWYPLLFPTDSIESWLIRGVLMTLVYEILLHSLSPLERALWETSHAKRLRTSVTRFARAERPLRSRSLLAVTAIAVPVALMGLAPAHPLSHQGGQHTSVRHVTEVKRVVKVERRTIAMARPAATAADTTATPAPAARRYTPPVGRTTATPRTPGDSTTGRASDTGHTGDATSSEDTATTGNTPAPPTSDSSTSSTTTQPTGDSADTTAQPQQRVLAPSRSA